MNSSLYLTLSASVLDWLLLKAELFVTLSFASTLHLCVCVTGAFTESVCVVVCMTFHFHPVHECVPTAHSCVNLCLYVDAVRR